MLRVDRFQLSVLVRFLIILVYKSTFTANDEIPVETMLSPSDGHRKYERKQQKSSDSSQDLLGDLCTYLTY